MLIRIYADLQGLSRELAKQGLVGHDVRALAPFTASLTSTYPLLDFVHAGHGYAGTMSKMKGLLQPTFSRTTLNVHHREF